MNRVFLFALVAASLAGCLDDEPAPTWTPPTTQAEPSYTNVQPASVKGLDFVAQIKDANGTPMPSGSGVWVFGDVAYASALGAGFFIADISDPTQPELLYKEHEDGISGFSRDADLVVHDDGRLTLVLATQGDGMHLWNVTNPAQPEFAERVNIAYNHNVAVIPGTPYVFNSQSGGLGRQNEIVDASNPYAPDVMGAYGTHGCHDITFHGELGDDDFRAYCAGIQETQIWDMTGFDPASQQFGIRVISRVSFDDDPANSPVIGNPALQSYPVRTLHHLAMVNEDATVLIIGDEQNGGGTPGGCFVYDETTGVRSPTGALWFYDLSDESAPALMGWLSPPLVAPTVDPVVPDPSVVDPTNPTGVVNVLRPYTAGVPNCTAHFGSLVPGEEKMVMAWYSAGVLLIDFSNIQSPVILDQYQPDPTNPWDARIHGGYVFTGDIARGMDVLQLV